MDEPATLRPAGFWMRAGAYLIDGMVLAIPTAIGYALLPPKVGMIFRLFVAAVYFSWMPVEAEGQTLGKMAAGIGVIRTDGEPLTIGRMFARWLGYLLSSLTVGLGFACAAFTPEKRALHDYIVDTRVIYIEEVPYWRRAIVIGVAIVVPLIATAILTVIALFNHH